jgi:DNA mismatch endonuclease (patch repair protein)
MADIYSKEIRSAVMSSIRSKNTKPEMVVRRFLHSQGLRYKVHLKQLPGKPDIVFTKKRIVIFINGCFWHGHINCKNAKIPETNKQFWVNKITLNAKRDKHNVALLRKIGWKVITIWGCQLHTKNANRTLQKLLPKLSLKY